MTKRVRIDLGAKNPGYYIHLDGEEEPASDQVAVSWLARYDVVLNQPSLSDSTGMAQTMDYFVRPTK